MTKSRYEDYWLSKSRKKEIKAQVKSKPVKDDYDMRQVRRKMRDPANREWFKGIPKVGKYISTRYRSSGMFKSAYSFARSEAEFYDMARYADY